MDEILSTLKSSRCIALVYSSLGAHARFRAPELPGRWFVAAFEPLGHSGAAVRQTLFRMEKKGELLTRKAGREKLYRLSPLGQSAVDISYRKMTIPTEAEWDGEWTVLAYHFEASQRSDRDWLKWMLELEGFAALDRGLYIHPRDRWARVEQAVAELDSQPRIHCFRGRRQDAETDQELAQRLWDLLALNARYQVITQQFAAFLETPSPLSPADAFALRLALAIRYSEVAWDDPELPLELLPDDWVGRQVRDMTIALYQRCIEGALAHGDALLQ